MIIQKIFQNVKKVNLYWGDPERATHRRVCCEFVLYFFVCICSTSCCKSLTALSYFVHSCIIR